jgi:hypothetical protein
MRLSVRERLIVRRIAKESAERYRGEGIYKRALVVAQNAAEHGIWCSRLASGEGAAAAECERCEQRQKAMMIEDGIPEERAEEAVEEQLRRARTT